MDRMMAKYGGAEVLRRAVSGMLPKNRLRDVRLARLKGTCAGAFPTPWMWEGGVRGKMDGIAADEIQRSRARDTRTRRISLRSMMGRSGIKRRW